ncbi:MAG: ABC transporter ATP-binding protein [Treponema sp.]|jgi:putative ABC transport system ATP-binding protein|nr:ABC transporter ATP-binding protein [Treponema sp.]
MAVIEMKGIKRIYKLESKKEKKRAATGEGPVVVQALRGVDFSAEAGEFVFVMGPSGSGKSTLMNVIGCLDKPSEGSYVLDGINVSAANGNTFALIRNKKIGFVFQSFNLLARTTALENVELPLFYNRKDRRNRRERALEVLREVGLEDRLHHMPSQLSGGQQQRVAIARAMVNDPAFILADEPTGALDSEMSLEIMTLLQELNNRGKTIIMVTHEPELACYAKRVVTLRDGQLVSDRWITERRSAAEALARWKQDHSLLSGKEEAA